MPEDHLSAKLGDVSKAASNRLTTRAPTAMVESIEDNTV